MMFERTQYWIDQLVGNWIFHFVIRLIALMVISVSTYSITAHNGNHLARANPETEAAPTDPRPDFEIRIVGEPSAEQAQKEPSRTEPDLTEAMSGEKPPPVLEETIPETTWNIEENEISVDAVLVPRKEIVISSSRDGKITNIPLENGDRFKKNDVLIRYDCSDLEAEADMADIQKELSETKSQDGERLFKLDIISEIDRLGIELENKQAVAKRKLYEARMNDCVIKASFNGHVTKRLANEGEYTRTDRVLMEVVSSDPLNVEFLLPSKWLRWINTGTPLQVKVNETDKSYPAHIIRIYGAVDPVSQTIQIRAALDEYKDPLLPGMSGKADINIGQSEKAGIVGYLARSLESADNMHRN